MIRSRTCKQAVMGGLGSVVFGPLAVGSSVRSIMLQSTGSGTATDKVNVQLFSVSSAEGWAEGSNSAAPVGQPLLAADEVLYGSVGPSGGVGISVGRLPMEIPVNVKIAQNRFIIAQIGFTYLDIVNISLFTDEAPNQV